MKGKVSPALLARCLADLESGRLTIEECLAAHQSVAQELRGLLEAAQAITPPPLVTPDLAFRRRGRAALLAAIAGESHAATTARFQRFWRAMWHAWGQRPALATQTTGMRRMGMPALIIALVIALTAAAGGGAVYAAQDALPGDALYQVKTTVEGLQLTIAAGDEEKAQTYLDLAAKRIAEIDRASQRGRPAAAGLAAADFAQDVAQADQYLAQAAASGKDVSGLATRLADALGRHQKALAAARDRANGHAKDALTEAAEAAEHVLTLAGSQPAVGRDDDDDVTHPLTGTVAAGKSKGRPEATTSISPTVALTLTQAISNVQNLANDTEVRGKSYNGLLAKLRAAEEALERGQRYVAVRIMDAFLGELNAMQRAGHITPQHYSTLYTQYSALVNSLDSTPKAQVAPNQQGPAPGKPDTQGGPPKGKP